MKRQNPTLCRAWLADNHKALWRGIAGVGVRFGHFALRGPRLAPVAGGKGPFARKTLYGKWFLAAPAGRGQPAAVPTCRAARAPAANRQNAGIGVIQVTRKGKRLVRFPSLPLKDLHRVLSLPLKGKGGPLSLVAAKGLASGSFLALERQ
ncbi:MAG TPA: hypothetical protein PKC03_12190, partial [Dokdonella sp.]|nr:hypothetical protein [Dokdonella sp.]